MPQLASRSIRPLLKWAGGKRQLLPELRRHYPDHFDRYIEPFFGSGAVFFDLLNSGRLHGRRAKLADLNPDLVGCCLAVRDDVEAVVRSLQTLASGHAAQRGSDFYYVVRDRFNILRSAGGLRGLYTPDMAAMFIYLNRTGFNGLFRQNRAGAFNVPAGRYTNPRICDPEHLRAVALAWQQHGVSIALTSFDATLAEAGRGDFVYCDPPYAPLSRTASFAHYMAGGFTAFDQVRLQQAVFAAATRGAAVVVSNSSAAEIVTGYSSREALAAGLVVRRVDARRAINADARLRGTVEELVVSNVEVAERLDRIASATRSRPTMLKAGVREKKVRSA